MDFFLHIDKHLISFVSVYGLWSYALLFLIIFCETGLVIAPFLPGDSLLFAAGAFLALPRSPLNGFLLFGLLLVAAILGNQVNYLLGRWIGPKVFNFDNSWIFNKKNLNLAHNFYEKHGGKAIIIARFLPLIRTCIPFIAGVGTMSLGKFSLYNAISAVAWVGGILSCGYFLGSIPYVKEHFSLFVLLIIGISLLPAGMSLILAKK